MKKVNKSIIVLGMHRSGTSMVAGVLSILGVKMLPPVKTWKEYWLKDESNPFGHFEDEDFYYLDTEILKSAGGNWLYPPKHEDILNQKKGFENKISNLIKIREKELWGWKDPRTVLTIELYLPYLKNPYFIVCHRNKFEIAKSLKRRNGLEIDKAMKLVEIYENQIINFFNRHSELKNLDVNYDNANKAPIKLIKELINFIEIQPSDQKVRTAINFVLPHEKVRKISRLIKIKKLIKDFFENPLEVIKLLMKR